MSLRFNDLFRQVADVSLLSHYFTIYTGIGILTDYPSSAPVGFDLGPD